MFKKPKVDAVADVFASEPSWVQTTATNACSVAAERFDENAAEFRKVAEILRGGGTVVMFADGESGAVAADRLAEQFERQAADTRRLRARIEGDVGSEGME